MKKFLCISVFTLSFFALNAQELPDIVPPTPEVASLGKYIDTPVNEFTGIPKVGIPIYDIKQGRINHSINLSYHAQGVKVEEIASRVGMGWTLKAGGVIHRQMRKLPDNVQHGYLRTNETVEDLSNAIANPYDCTAHEYVVNLLIGPNQFRRDFEPDLFTFSFGGYSGRFYFNQQTGEPILEEASPLKIEWIDYEYNHESASHQQNYNYFKITTPGGVEYYFGVNKDKTDYAKIYKGGEDMENVYTTGPYGTSVDETDSSSYERYVSTWQLMEIYDPINDSSVTFEYDLFNLGTVIRRLATSVIVEEHRYTPVVNITYEKQISEQIEKEYALSKINFKQGSIDFISDTQDRQDLNGAYALKGVNVHDINNSLIKSYELEHFFSNNNHGNSDMSSYHTSSNDIKYRLFLSELKEYEINRITNSIISSNYKSHSFDYHNPNSLPHRLSTAQDFWGFHNNADSNTNLMPLNSAYFGNYGIQSYQLGNADRSVNEEHSKDGVLTKITYPTGGYTEYIYENNTASKDIPIQSFCEISPDTDPLTYEPDNYQDVNYSFNETNPDEYYVGSGGEAPFYVMYFDIGDVPTSGLNIHQIVNFNYTNHNNGYPDGDEPYWEAYIQKKENGLWPSSYIGSRIYNFNDSGSNEVMLDTNTEYRIIVNWINDTSGPWNPNYTGDVYGEGDHTPDWNLAFTVLEEVEGSTVDSDIYVTGGLRIKEIKTSDLRGNTYTTSYSYVDQNNETTGHLVSLPYRFSDKWLRPNSGAGASANDGATFYKYSSGITAALSSTQGSYTGYTKVTRVNEGGSNGKEEFNFSFERDDCNFSTVYNNSYGFISGDSSWAVATTPLLNEELQRGKLLSKIDYNAQDSKVRQLTNTYELKTYQEQKAFVYRKWGPTAWGGAGGGPPCNNDTAIINEYTLKSRSNLLKEQVSIIYDVNGNNPMTNTTNYYYDNDNHLQPTRIVTTNSQGEVITQETTYAHEEGDTRLINEHRIIEPIGTKVFNETSLLSETFTVYQDDNGLYLPKIIQTAKNGGSLDDRITYHHYDAFGNPLEVSKTNGTSISYIWGYNNSFPVAKIENATYSVILSLPTFSSGMILSEGLNITQETELRALSNAVVTTYTYDPLIGVTSMTNPRGHSITYNYDEFNRLESIVDEDGYLVSENDYNYQLISGIQNYVKNTMYLVENTDGITNAITGNPLTDDDKVESITYFDGLGRGIQSITKQAGGQRQDIVSSIGYDDYGRQLREYLPYSRTNSSLDFDVNLLPDANGNISALNTQYISKYTDDLTGNVNPYSEKVLEASPLGRVLEQAAPGSDWAVGNGHTITFGYETNTLNQLDPFNSANNTYDNVIHFDVFHPKENNILNTEKTELIYIGHYASNELFKTITKDENWTSGKDHTTEEFKNKQGQVILKRTFNDNEPHDTYYVYDDFGNLTYVLPPTASDEILTQDTAGRVASQINYPWISLVNVDKSFALDYNKKLSDYENANILNADIDNAYGGQGGFTVTTIDNSEQVLLSINFSATQALGLKKGELVSLKDYGSHKDTELGKISGNDYSYTFYIKNNAIHIDGSGTLNGINEVFDSTSKLTYDQDYLWTNLVNIDKKFASAHENDVLAHAKATNQDPLNVYLNNEYGGQGGLNITIDENDNFVLSFNINSTSPLELKQGVVLNLNTKRRFNDGYLGHLSGNGYSYDFELRGNNIVITGSGTGQSFSGVFFPNPPADEDPVIRAQVIEGLGYIYHYDYRNRLVEKKIPGKGWEHIVYDQLDRPILTQDAKQRLTNEWLFTKYDILERVTYTGKYQYTAQGNEDNSGRLELQTIANNQTTLYETKTASVQTINGSTVHYTNNCFPNASNIDLLTINYYDDYSNTHLDTSDLIKQAGDMVYDEAIDTNAKLLNTVSSVRVLGTDDWITSVSYFDEDDMPIYVASKNEYLNTSDVATTDYDFIGKTLKIENTHRKDSNAPIITEDVFSYDHASRLLTQTQTINGSTPEQIVKNSYDEFGQLENKKVGGVTLGNGLQTVDYEYNIRGWLKSINDDDHSDNDLFDFNIKYNNPDQGIALYNGNISETFWKTANDNKVRGYNYTYDALNRIEKANYNGNYALVGTTNVMENYSLIGENDTEGITYDKNGNIISLRRMGLQQTTNLIDVIDDLNYSYEPLSNKLLSVSDNASEDGFKDSNTATKNDYLYDINGNMIQDLNKNITAITYNHLNLPNKVTFSAGNALGSDEIHYIYDATGVKLKKTVIDMSENNGINSQSNDITEYAGGYIYQKSGNYTHNGQDWQGNELNQGLKFFSQPEGYIEPNNSNGFDYVYSYLDHLGNVRLSYKSNNGTLEIIEENNYYPFGLKHKGYNDVVSANVNSVASKFKYNSKEFNDELGLDWYDYGARNYDAALGRWFGVDELAEDYYYDSPYVYTTNNPALYIDPDGRYWKPTINEDGSTSYVAEEGDDVQSFVDQYGVTYDQAKELLNGNEHNIQAGITTVSGQDVYDMNPYDSENKSEVLKLKKGTNQQKWDHFVFATDHSRSKGGYAFSMSEYFKPAGSLKGEVSFEIDGETHSLNMDIDSGRPGTFDGSGSSLLENSPFKSKYTSGRTYPNEQANIHIRMYHPKTGNYSGQDSVIYTTRSSVDAIYKRLKKDIPKYNYISLNNKSKN